MALVTDWSLPFTMPKLITTILKKETTVSANWTIPSKTGTFITTPFTPYRVYIQVRWSVRKERFAQCKTIQHTIEFTGGQHHERGRRLRRNSNNIDIKNNLVIIQTPGYNYYPNQLVHTEPGATISNLTVWTIHYQSGRWKPNHLSPSLLNPLINLKSPDQSFPLPNRKPSTPYYIPAKRKFRW